MAASGFQLFFFERVLNLQGCLVAIDTMRDSVTGCSRYTNYEPVEGFAIGMPSSRGTIGAARPTDEAADAPSRLHGCTETAVHGRGA